VKYFWMVFSLFFIFLCGSANRGVQKVEVRKTAAGYQLFRGGKPYYIKGAGILDHYGTLCEYGGNSVRTWGITEWDEVFGLAEKHGLTVCAGIWLEQERQGFDYSDTAATRDQFEATKEAILKYKDHPSLLMWGVGNELDLDYTNPRVWDAVEAVARFIHEVDGNHPTMTATAFIEKEEVEFIQDRCPHIDILCVNAYAGLPVLSRFIRDFVWNGPYIIGEWGTFGHWEVGKTSWNEPIEFTSTEKAVLYQNEYDTYIANDPACLGAYVFLWGSKQERTATWYSMFLPGGEKTEVVDVMHRLWKGTWPENRSPHLDSLRLNDRAASSSIILEPGSECQAVVYARDPEGDALRLSWEILYETTDKRTGGDEENKPDEVEGLNIRPEGMTLRFTAPTKEGPYRLFVIVLDQKGSGAHANIPFFVREIN
jgi:hypothetical protein